MRMLTEAWFEFDGIRCGDRGLRLLRMPKRPIPAPRGEAVVVPGRSGYVWIPQNALEWVEIHVDCETEEGFDADAFAAWISGEGLLRFSDMPARAYRCKVIDAVLSENAYARFDTRRLRISFTAQPYRYLFPEPEEIVLSAAGMLTNPATADSRPRIQVAGSGNAALLVSGALIEFTGLSDGGAVVDCEMRDCLSYDGLSLINERVAMADFPKLRPGVNAVSWTGGITEVRIQPRWRYL